MDDTPLRPRDAESAANTSAGDAARPMAEREQDTVQKASAPLGALAGAAAGAAAGLSSYVFGPIAAPIGALIGAIVGGTGGFAAGQATTQPVYSEADDAHYRALYEGSPEYAAERGFDVARPAYQFGHLAAYTPDYRGREFESIEPELQRAWAADREFVAGHGDWSVARRHVRDAYGHARSEGAGVRRAAGVVGSAGSAVDPVELERARSGLSSVDGAGDAGAITYDHAGYADRAASPRVARDAAAAGADGLGERVEVDANSARRDDAEGF